MSHPFSSDTIPFLSGEGEMSPPFFIGYHPFSSNTNSLLISRMGKMSHPFSLRTIPFHRIQIPFLSGDGEMSHPFSSSTIPFHRIKIPFLSGDGEMSHPFSSVTMLPFLAALFIGYHSYFIEYHPPLLESLFMGYHPFHWMPSFPTSHQISDTPANFI